MRLKEFKLHQKGVITKVNAQGTHERRLFEMGFLPGTLVELKYIAPLGSPIAVKVRGYEIVLNNSDIDALEVQLKDEK
ncbi:MAG: FeoA family protein [Succinivibrionaceae bacterium]|nr:FeoA family protein [Ruminobacter sp.]MDY5780190.1 FeoA family protein [Succinivibrionaceae bacterium]MEE1340321.1 FeoA family protein [Succinivibrionaceae bacterium]